MKFYLEFLSNVWCVISYEQLTYDSDHIEFGTRESISVNFCNGETLRCISWPCMCLCPHSDDVLLFFFKRGISLRFTENPFHAPLPFPDEQEDELASALGSCLTSPRSTSRMCENLSFYENSPKISTASLLYVVLKPVHCSC